MLYRWTLPRIVRRWRSSPSIRRYWDGSTRPDWSLGKQHWTYLERWCCDLGHWRCVSHRMGYVSSLPYIVILASMRRIYREKVRGPPQTYKLQKQIPRCVVVKISSLKVFVSVCTRILYSVVWKSVLFSSGVERTNRVCVKLDHNKGCFGELFSCTFLICYSSRRTYEFVPQDLVATDSFFKCPSMLKLICEILTYLLTYGNF